MLTGNQGQHQITAKMLRVDLCHYLANNAGQVLRLLFPWDTGSLLSGIQGPVPWGHRLLFPRDTDSLLPRVTGSLQVEDEQH